MANAPTRPPNRNNHLAGRPPRGPRRVPRTPRRDYNETRALITKAVETLRKNKRNEELADAVEYTLTPDYIASGRYELVEKGTAGKRNMAISTQKFVRNHLKRASEAVGSSMTELVSEALTELAAGRFTPPQTPLSKGASGKGKEDSFPGEGSLPANINVRVDSELREKADERCDELSGELGWHVKPGFAVLQYALRKFPMAKPEADAGE